METETLEGLYVPSSIFNSHYTIISSFVTTQVSRWVWEKKKYKIKASSKSGCAIGNTSMNSVVHISKIMSVQSYSRFHHFWMCLTHWGQNKNGGQFTIIFKPIYSNEKKIYLIQISLKYFPKVPINNMPILVQIMAWCQPGYNPPSEPIMVSLLIHIYVTRPQWVNPESYYQSDVFLSFVWTCQESLIPLCKLEVHSTVLRQRSWD